MNNFLDILKYLVYGMIVYILFTYVPQVKMPLSDVMVITIVIMMTYIFLDILVPQAKLERFDTDFLDSQNPNVKSEESGDVSSNDPEFINNPNPTSEGISGSDYVDESNVYQFSSNNNPADSSMTVAQILVGSGMSTDQISDLLKLCKVNKRDCYNKINMMKEDEIISSTEFDTLIQILIGDKSTFEKLINNLDLTQEEKNQMLTICKFNKSECITEINNLTSINDEQKIELLDELDKMYNSEYLLGITALSEEEKQLIRDSCKDTKDKCSNTINNFSGINNNIQELLLNSYNLPIVQEENNQLEVTAPIIEDEMIPIVINLLKNYEMTEESIKNLHTLCKDNSEKCVNKLNEMQLSGVLNNNAKIIINVLYGLNNYINLAPVIMKNSLTPDQVLELSYVCNKNIPVSMCTSVLNKFLSAGLITEDQSEDILDKLRKLNTGLNIQGSEVVNQLLENGDLTTKQGAGIHLACTLKNNQNCNQTLKQLTLTGKITDNQMREILRSYNKSDIIELDSKQFGSISNESELGSRQTDKLQTLTDAYGESEMKFSQLDPEMHKPLGEYTNDFNNSFEYGYSYLNTTKWSVPMYRPPVCKTEENCKVCATATSGYPVDVKEWNNSRKIMPPDNINLEYINKLNQGN